MKLIDLLTKLANNDDVPEKIKYKGHIYYFDEGIYRDCDDNTKTLKYAFELYYMERCLLHEIDIIQEKDKKLELEEIDENTDIISFDDLKSPYNFNEEMFMKYIIIYQNLINKLIRNQTKIIDELNKLRKEEK